MSTEQKLLAEVLEAHGGIEQWKTHENLTARLSITGELWKIKGFEGLLENLTFKMKLHEQSGIFSDFPNQGLNSFFEPELITIFDQDWNIADHLFNPYQSLKGKHIRSPWNLPQLVYFAAYATWNYLTAPFSFTLPATELEHLPDWEEDGQVWRRLAVTSPSGFAVHNSRQIYFFGPDGLLRRQNYFPDVLGGAPAAQFVSNYREFSGIRFPTERKVFMMGDDGSYLSDFTLADLRLHEILFD